MPWESPPNLVSSPSTCITRSDNRRLALTSTPIPIALANPAVPHCTADGHTIVMTSIESEGNVFYLVYINSGERKDLETSPNLRGFPTISPDGHWAYVSDETGRWEIFVRAMDDTERRWQLTTSGGEEPIWDKSGHALFYRYGDRWMRIDLSMTPTLKAGQFVQVLQGPYVNIPGYSYNIAPDGRFLVLSLNFRI